jgi:hypothetical protein
VDASAHLKQNLQFLLRSATRSVPFSYAANYGPDYPPGYGIDPEVQTEFPEAWYARPTTAMNYEYYGFHTFSSNLNYSILDVARPVVENFLWRNFVYDSSEYTWYGPTNGLDDSLCVDYPYLRNVDPPTEYQYQGDGSETPLPLALVNSTSTATWVQDGPDYAEPPFLWELGMETNTTEANLPAGVSNLFGLVFDTDMLMADPFTLPTVWSSGGPAQSINLGDFYTTTDIPILQTTNYFFVSQTPYFTLGAPRPPMPGSPDFTVTNQSPLLIAPWGQLFTVSGWAKQAIANGYPNKYAYLEQYFDSAYMIATNGDMTTNSAGLLSPYGEFFPTQPGPAALLTLPDIDTGQRGTGIVNVIKLQLDVNHDGNMDLSFGGPDNTSPQIPYVFWVNNDFDRLFYDSMDKTTYEDSVLSDVCPATPKVATPDCNYRDSHFHRVIPTMRDLEDFARLWIVGVSDFVTNLPPSTITLSWGDIDNPDPNNPTIDLFQAAEFDGGMAYLTSDVMASIQTNTSLCPYIGRLAPGDSLRLNGSQFTNGWAGDHFIWCGVSNGTGQLTLSIAQGGTNILAQTSVYIQLLDIKQMYERRTVGESPNLPPKNNATLVQSPNAIPFKYGPPSSPTPYILFVHGWNLESWLKDRFAETAFKRLYWQGYQGRFGSFRWPTDFGFKGSYLQLALDNNQKDNFDNSEYTAYQSAAGLANLLAQLRTTYGTNLYLYAVSHGNMVCSEALRLAGTGQLVGTYLASQAAVSAHTYDSTVPSYSFYYPPWSRSPDTPNIYTNWFAGNKGGGAGRIINFFNVNDYAFQRSVWQLDELMKPDKNVLESGTNWGYSYSGATNDPSPWNSFNKDTLLLFGPLLVVDFDIVNVLDNRYEVMAYGAQSWTTALGATPQGSTPGVLNNVSLNVDLSQIWPPDLINPSLPFSEHFYHSGEFRGAYWQQQNYWQALLSRQNGLGLKNP